MPNSNTAPTPHAAIMSPAVTLALPCVVPFQGKDARLNEIPNKTPDQDKALLNNVGSPVTPSLQTVQPTTRYAEARQMTKPHTKWSVCPPPAIQNAPGASCLDLSQP
jgi:hypothetical protein